MSSSIVVTVVESPFFPDFSDLYDHKGLLESRVDSIRKAISLIKKQPAAYIVVEFFYAYSTNYSGIYKSNIEVLLVSLRKYSPNTKVIVLSKKSEIKFINVLEAVDYPLHGVLQLPTSLSKMEDLLG
ncbi:hypothetical protein N9345_05865 [Candidatus Thioglobus sp.]|nr:hypothetical protein [Candidatus Thioglobus sp.]MDB3870008.1 hypothetical protein [Candidatus Thioglobus sp.]MDB3893687.1 hypothetical protein [Candidatus Thioglobus sp.]MDC0388540.1 hypothetical protein [Candidatus Thioglobus sp.]MDC0888741.1 hypothetical protein [Candidatus Thioglobus sp.]